MHALPISVGFFFVSVMKSFFDMPIKMSKNIYTSDFIVQFCIAFLKSIGCMSSFASVNGPQCKISLRTTFSLMTLSIKGLHVALSMNDTQHINAPLLCLLSGFIYYYAECLYNECYYVESLYAECCGAFSETKATC